MAVWVTGSAAQLLADPSARTAEGWQVSGSFQNFEANYTIDTIYKRLTTPDFSRKSYSLQASAALRPRLDAFFAAGLTDDVDNSDHPVIVGDGVIFGAGLRGLLWASGNFSLTAYGQFSRMTESFTDELVRGSVIGTHTDERDIELMELLIGALAAYSTGGLTLYAGPEALAYEDGNYDYRTTLADGSLYAEDTLDIERTNPVGARVGARYQFSSFWISLALAFGHEQSQMVSAGWIF